MPGGPTRAARCWPVVAVLAVPALLAAPGPAQAAHGPDSDCPPGFTSERRWQDRSGADGALLVAEIAADIAGDLDNSVATAITGSVAQVLRIVAYGLETKNEITLACVVGSHWTDQDTLLLLGLQQGLGLSTTPDAAALVLGPESRPPSGTNPYETSPADAAGVRIGFLDRPASSATEAGGAALPQGVKQVVEQVLSDMEEHTGCACATARRYQVEAEAHLAQGAHKAAYASFRRAYVAAVTAADGPPPA